MRAGQGGLSLKLPGDALFSSRQLRYLILPLILEQLLAVLIGMADTVMVTAVGEKAVAAISLVDTMNVLLIQLFAALGAGGAVVAAQYVGRGEDDNACRAAKQLMTVTLLVSALVTLPSALFNGGILRFVFGALDDETMAYARTYFFITALSYPPLALYNSCAGLLRAQGDSRSTLWISLVMNLINILGNALLIYGLRMNVAGAGLATLLSRLTGAVIAMRLMTRAKRRVRIIRPLRLEWDGKMIARIFSIGVPGGLENSLFQVGKLLIASLIAAFSSALVAANAIANTVASFVNLPSSAIGLALITVVGQCAGAGRPEQARMYAKRLCALAVLCILPTNLSLLLFPSFFTGLFALSAQAASAAAYILRLYAVFSILLHVPSFTLPCALRAAGDARFTMTASILSMLLFRVAFSYLFVRGMGMELTGVWLAMFVDWIARSACFVVRFRGKKWLKHQVI